MEKFRKHIFLILAIIVGIFLCIYALTYGKYVFNSAWDYYLKSKGFYFSSDNLSANVAKNVNNLWDGGSVHFNIRNNLNQAVVSNYDIGYTIICTIKGEAASYTECHLNGTESNTEDGMLNSIQRCNNTTGDEIDVSAFNQTECETGGYTWLNEIAMKDFYFDVAVTDIGYVLKDVVVSVTVASTTPYTKTISGDFTLHKSVMEEDKLTMNYKNYTNYDKLIVSNSYSDTKCVKVTWDSSKLIINEDKSKFSSYGEDTNGYINEIKFNVGAKESQSYRFYKKNFDIIYTVTEFSIEESDGC